MLSTNLEPHNLMDEAFLRRVRYKVHVPDPTRDEFAEIWRRVCASQEIPYREEVISDLISRHYVAKGRAFHGSHPRDLLNHVIHLCRYLGRDPELTTKLLDEACETYFVDDSTDI
jgi:SpoVK/Ycf46/Vps4 family AAA+-type ATPase